MVMCFRCRVIVLLAGISGLAAPAMAQTALDRVDPAQAERRVDPIDKSRESVPVSVQQNAIERPRSNYTVRVGGVRILGLKSLPQAAFADIVTDYLGKTLTASELADLTDRVARRARDRGYVFAKAWIEPQQVMAGLIDIKIDKGAIDEVRLRAPAIERFKRRWRRSSPAAR